MARGGGESYTPHMDLKAPDVAAAYAAFERGEYATSLDLARRILSTRPAYADMRNLAGISLALLGDSEAALEELDAAIAINPEYVEALLNRALVLNDLGRFDEAKETLERASAREQSAADGIPAIAAARIANAHAHIGDLYTAVGAHERAWREYRTALELRPNFPDVRHRAGRTLLELGRVKEAVRMLRRVVLDTPSYTPARLDLGLALLRDGDVDAARAEWDACRAEGIDSPQLRAYLALVDQSERAKPQSGGDAG